MDGAQVLRVRVLGELTASYDGRELDLGGRRQRAVLAVLLLARGEVVPAERVVDAVWGERPPANAAGALQSYVSHLRRSLQPDVPARARSSVIVREGTGYAVRLPADAVDGWRFERLVREADGADPVEVRVLLGEALGLWRGPALVEYADEPWAEPEVARLTELRSLARERLLEARLEVEDPALSVAELEVMVAEAPLREDRWRLLALALYRSHRQADALSALRRAREVLAEQLGVDPGPALRELEVQVLQQAPSLSPQRPVSKPAQGYAAASAGSDRTAPGASGASGAAGAAPASAGADPEPDLVDRAGELAVLRDALDRLAAGSPGLLVITGPAGIGKSRLLDEATRLASRRSVRVLAARGSPLESAFGFGVVRQLFEPELTEAERREQLLRGAATTARGVFDLSGGAGPGASAPAEAHDPTPAEPDRAEGFPVLHGLYWLAVNLAAEGPVVLVVDDVQWCDSASLRFLAYLGRRLARLPILVLAALRVGEDPDREDVFAELAHDPEARVLHPRPMSDGATAELVRRRLGAPPAALFLAACQRTTAGNPFLLTQLLQTLASEGVRPDSSHADQVVAVGSRAVSGRVQLRLRRLPSDVVQVAKAAAVLADGASLPALSSLADTSEVRTAEALALLSRAEILRDERQVSFTHPLVRDAVYEAMPAGERGLLHERAASVLRERGADFEQVAAHLLAAPPRGDDEVVGLLLAAARSATDRGAAESAVTYLRRALDESPSGARSGDVLVELGLRETRLDGQAAVAHLGQAYELQEDPGLRARIAIATASTQVFASPPGEATTFAGRARAALPGALVDERQALLALQRIGGFLHGDREGWSTPATRLEGEGPGARMLAVTLALEALVRGEDRARAVDLARFALAGDHLVGVDEGLFWVNAAAVRILADDDIGDFWSRARAASRARGSVFAALSASLWEGFWLWRRGELHEALACLRSALDQDQLWGGTRAGEPFARAFQIGVHLDRGDVASARAAADAVRSHRGFGEGARVLHLAEAQLLVAEGRFDEALAAVDRVVRQDTLPILNPVWNPWRSVRAAALHGLGRTPGALALLDEEVRLLRGWGAPSSLGRALALRGQLRDDGLPDLTEAVRLLTPTWAAIDLARARCALGSRPELGEDEAVPLLLDAHWLASERGAAGVVAHACAELRRRGHDVEAAGVEGGAGARPLSRTERQILELTASGLEAHEVAQRLFVTPGTVLAVLDECAFGDGSGNPQVAATMMGAQENGRLA